MLDPAVVKLESYSRPRRNRWTFAKIHRLVMDVLLLILFLIGAYKLIWSELRPDSPSHQEGCPAPTTPVRGRSAEEVHAETKTAKVQTTTTPPIQATARKVQPHWVLTNQLKGPPPRRPSTYSPAFLNSDSTVWASEESKGSICERMRRKPPEYAW